MVLITSVAEYYFMFLIDLYLFLFPFIGHFPIVVLLLSFIYYYVLCGASLVAQFVKNLPPAFDPGLGRSPGEGTGNPLQYSCLENPHGQRRMAGYSPWNSPGQNTGVGSLSLLQGVFPTQESNPGLPRCRWILYQLSHQGSPRILEWVAYPFSSRSSQLRNRTWVSCIAVGFFTI